MDSKGKYFFLDEKIRWSSLTVDRSLFALYNIISICLSVVLLFAGLFVGKLNYKSLNDFLNNWPEHQVVQFQPNGTNALPVVIEQDDSTNVLIKNIIIHAVIMFLKGLSGFFVFLILEKWIFRVWYTLMSIELVSEIFYYFRFINSRASPINYLATGFILPIVLVHLYICLVVMVTLFRIVSMQENYQDKHGDDGEN